MFNFSFDKRFLIIMIILMILPNIISYISNPGALFVLLIGIPGVLIAITFHEFAHAYAAYKLGDDTAKREGRLSLNPFDHLDPVGSLLLLFAGFGWGKPVHVNPTNYTRKMSMEKGEAIVSIAGPVMNIILAFVFAIIQCLIIRYGRNLAFFTTTMGRILMVMIDSTIAVNVGLGIFNLIPLPPLDGSKVIMPILPYKAKQFFISNEHIFYIIFVLIWITGIAGMIISPAINIVEKGILELAKMLIL